MLKYGKGIIFNPDNLDPLNIDRQTAALVPKGATALDIGCATGFFGEYLIKEKKCIVDGVDIGLAEAKEAKEKLRYVILGDIENVETIRKINQKYDLIIASMIIEHLKDPWSALKQWKKLLKKDGFILVSTSNIAHWSMRLKLLHGDFKYQRYGLLDNTHLRFFTYDTFQQLVKDCGYTIADLKVDPVGGGQPRLSNFFSNLFPNLFVYQILIKACPK